MISSVESFGDEMLEKFGTRLFFPADELYLRAEIPLPSEDFYEGYMQIENGVGMLRSFIEEFSLAKSDAMDMGRALKKRKSISVATGVLAYDTVSSLCDQAMKLCPNMKITVYKIENNFFGKSITVSGLLTGADIYEQLKDKELGKALLIPENALRQGDDDFLCGMTRKELSKKLRTKVVPSGDDGYELLRTILTV